MRATILARAISVASLALGIASPVSAQTTTRAETAAPPVVAVPAPPAGQLPATIKPAAYRLDLTVDPAKERFSGHVEIDVTSQASCGPIYLHGRNLAMARASVQAGGKTLTGDWKQVDPSGVVALGLNGCLPAGPATFSFDYDAPFGSGPAGMFRVKVGDDWYSWTQHESIDARASFPSFDEPGFKTPFTVTLRTPKGLTAVSNAPETSKADEAGLDVHRFAPTAPLPTYLVAMMVGPFAVVESTVPPSPQRKDPLPLRIISPKPNADRLTFALENSKPIVTHLEAYFGQPFPYPKLDQITTPILPGAMENAGADLYGDGILVLDDKASIPDKRSFGMIVSHELAHQWFGDLVTPAWWDDIWLNESFANWMGFRIGNEWRRDLNIGSGATAEGFAAMNTDSLLAGRPIHQKISSNTQIDAAFDSITYGKGGHVVAMIAAFMGDDKFRDGVRRYMAAHKYANASSADFFRAMAEVSGDPRILPAMQSFTDQQGVPVINLSRIKGGWQVEQSRYARFGSTAPETHWGVPICLRQGKVRDCLLLDGKQGTIMLKGSGPAMPNAGGTGYYRFELPRKDWDALIASADSLSGNEAIALADSLKASYLAGHADVGQLAALAKKLSANPDSHANGDALDGLEAVRASGLFDAKANIAYRTWVARLYMPILDKLGLDLKAGAYAGENPDRTQRRAAVVRAIGGIAKVKSLSDKLAHAGGLFLAGDRQALDPMWYGQALAALLDAEGKPAAERMIVTALATQDPDIRPTLLGTVASSGDKAIAKWLLDDFHDERLRPSERLNLIRGVISTSGTREMGYQWLKVHLDDLLGGSGGIFFASKLPQALNGFCSADRSDEIARALRPRLAGKTAELELERTIERIRSCGTLKAARMAEASAQAMKLK